MEVEDDGDLNEQPPTPSSLCRPPTAPAFSPTDRLALLPPPLLHHLLSFVPSHDFFFRCPSLSRYHRWIFRSSDLHRVYGQSRFGLRTPMWQNFSSWA